MAHVAELADDRSVGHLESLDHRAESRGDRVDDDAVFGALLDRTQESGLGSAIGVRVTTARRSPRERHGGDPGPVPAEKQLGGGADEAVNGERGTRGVQRPEAPEEV